MPRARQNKTDEAAVLCRQCRNFTRDTGGISRVAATGEYFMGLCALGHGCRWGKQYKVFADIPHICNDYAVHTDTEDIS